MAIEQNRTDFEKALTALGDYAEDAASIIHPDFYDAIQSVLNEYGHYIDDIDDIIERLDGFENAQ